MQHEKVVLITGCSSGIGMHAAVQLAQAGYRVYATMRNLDKSENLKQLALEKQVPLQVLPLDVQDQQSIEQCVQQIIRREGKIDVLVNNAGFGSVRSLEQASMPEIESIMDVNYYGVVRCIKAVLPGMRERKSGHIITVSSVGGLVGQPMNEIYCSAKFAVEGLVESMATYLEPFFGVKMSLVEPAGTKTEFVNRVLGDMQSTGGMRKDAYELVLNTYFQAATSNVGTVTNAQTADEVAAVIVQCANDEKPALRYQTSEFARKFCDAKLGNDPTGNQLQQNIRQILLNL